MMRSFIIIHNYDDNVKYEMQNTKSEVRNVAHEMQNPKRKIRNAKHKMRKNAVMQQCDNTIDMIVVRWGCHLSHLYDDMYVPLLPPIVLINDPSPDSSCTLCSSLIFAKIEEQSRVLACN